MLITSDVHRMTNATNIQTTYIFTSNPLYTAQTAYDLYNNAYTNNNNNTSYELQSTDNNYLYSLDSNNNNNDSNVGYTLEELHEIYRPISLLVHKLVIPIWWAIGFPGNCLAFSVWIQPRMRPSSGCYLAALAMTDLVFLVLHVLFELQFTWRIRVIVYPVLCEAFPMLFLSSQYLSLLLVLAFSVERYISICHPYQRDAFCSTKRAVRVIVGLTVMTLGLNAAQAYFWTYSDFNGGLCDLRREVEVAINDVVSVWTVWAWTTELLVFGAVPIATLVLNIRVMTETRRIQGDDKKRLEHSLSLRGGQKSGASRQRSYGGGGGGGAGGGGGGSSATTVMLLAVSFYLIAATLPVTFAYILYQHFPTGNATLTKEEIKFDPVWRTHFNFSTVNMAIRDLGMSHFALNFYIYVITGRIFRQELRRLWKKCLCRWCFFATPGGSGGSFYAYNPSSSDNPEVQTFYKLARGAAGSNENKNWTRTTLESIS